MGFSSQMFDSVTATLSQPFLKVFNFPSLATAEKLLSDVAGATSAEWISSPGTDPSRPVLGVKGSLANILKAESCLFEVRRSMSVKFSSPLIPTQPLDGSALSHNIFLHIPLIYSVCQTARLKKSLPYACALVYL